MRVMSSVASLELGLQIGDILFQIGDDVVAFLDVQLGLGGHTPLGGGLAELGGAALSP